MSSIPKGNKSFDTAWNDFCSAIVRKDSISAVDALKKITDATLMTLSENARFRVLSDLLDADLPEVAALFLDYHAIKLVAHKNNNAVIIRCMENKWLDLTRKLLAIENVVSPDNVSAITNCALEFGTCIEIWEQLLANDAIIAMVDNEVNIRNVSLSRLVNTGQVWLVEKKLERFDLDLPLKKEEARGYDFKMALRVAIDIKNFLMQKTLLHRMVNMYDRCDSGMLELADYAREQAQPYAEALIRMKYQLSSSRLEHYKKLENHKEKEIIDSFMPIPIRKLGSLFRPLANRVSSMLRMGSATRSYSFDGYGLIKAFAQRQPQALLTDGTVNQDDDMDAFNNICGHLIRENTDAFVHVMSYLPWFNMSTNPNQAQVNQNYMQIALSHTKLKK